MSTRMHLYHLNVTHSIVVGVLVLSSFGLGVPDAKPFIGTSETQRGVAEYVVSILPEFTIDRYAPKRKISITIQPHTGGPRWGCLWSLVLLSLSPEISLRLHLLPFVTLCPLRYARTPFAVPCRSFAPHDLYSNQYYYSQDSPIRCAISS